MSATEPATLAARCAPRTRAPAEPADGPGARRAGAAGARSLAGRLRPRRQAAARRAGGRRRRAPLRPGAWGDASGSALLDAAAHSFTWLRDLRALGTDAARLRARALVAEWIAAPPSEALAQPARRRRRPHHRLARPLRFLRRDRRRCIPPAADDAGWSSDARSLSAALPAEELDARALTALKGLIAAAVALPEHAGFLTRALRFLPQEIARQVLPDGCHAERSPAAQLAALQDLTEIRALLQAAQTQPPPALTSAIERMAPALRVLRHGDGGLALFNGSKEESSSLIDMVLTQAGRSRTRPVGAARRRLPAPAGRAQRADRRLRRAATGRASTAMPMPARCRWSCRSGATG